MDNLSFYISEYEHLKEEQLKRIEFRDHMIYLTLVAIGSVFAFSIEKHEYSFTFLVLPFFCIIMGWTYYANDRKVSSIGCYIKDKLLPKIESITNQPIGENWETIRGRELDRNTRKYIQLFIDVSLFSFSSFISIYVFYYLNTSISWYQYIIIVVESFLTLLLFILFVRNSHN